MVNAVLTFVLGFLFALIIAVIFYLSARVNSNSSNFYKNTICAGLLD